VTGTVRRIGFTVLKGARHVERDAAELTRVGPRGDRCFALVDVEGRRVLRTVENPALTRLTATWDDPLLTVTTPDGDAVTGTPQPTDEPLLSADYWDREARLTLLDGPYADALTAYLGRPVRLARTAPGDVVWAEPVSIVTTGALHRLADRIRAAGNPVPGALDVRFRATLTLDLSDDPAAGTVLRVGDAVLRVGRPIDRCAVVDIDPATGARADRVLTHLRTEGGELRFGVGAHVVTPGRVTRDAPVTTLGAVAVTD